MLRVYTNIKLCTNIFFIGDIVVGCIIFFEEPTEGEVSKVLVLRFKWN